MSSAAKINLQPVVAGVAFKRKEGCLDMPKKSIPYVAAASSKPPTTRTKQKVQARTSKRPLTPPGKASRPATNPSPKDQPEEESSWVNPLDMYPAVLYAVYLMMLALLWSRVIS